MRKAGLDVAQVHLRHLNPFPKDLGEILKRYDAVMVPEMNLGQLSLLIRAKYLVDVVGYNHVRGLPLKAAELAEAVTDLIETTTSEARATDAETQGDRAMTAPGDLQPTSPSPGSRACPRPRRS